MPIIPILIVEDFRPDAEKLKTLLEETDLDLLIDVADNKKDALRKINSGKYDVIFMDVVLDQRADDTLLNGMDLYQSIDAKKRPEVVFVTEHEAFSLRSYDLDAADFMPKPATFPMVCRALENAFRRLAVPINLKCVPQPEFALIEMTDKMCQRVQFSDIYFVQKVKGDNELAFFERNMRLDGFGKPVPRKAKKTIKEIVDFLPATEFVQVDQSTLVNMNFIVSFLKRKIVMSEGPQRSFAVTRSYIKELRQKLHVIE
ncbi:MULTISPECIES: LytR/AlgR family response regulator transcription factor [Sphingobacterium]|uniref:LytR/AlgR family response regulator transcription factor n=1 Tax=Sphingobacterium TaxID=28453 RepID=UPI002579EF1E|nr:MULTISPECIES: response regulator [Sphingobacterium]